MYKDYYFANVGQFSAVMEAGGYNPQYNKGYFKLSKDGEEFKMSFDEIRALTRENTELTTASMDRLSQIFDREKAGGDLAKYQDELKAHNITVHKWANLKSGQVANEQQSKDGFTIIDHENKICYTGKEMYDYANENGYVLDGKGTKLELGESVFLNIDGVKTKMQRGRNGKIISIAAKEELVIPNEVLGQKLSEEQKKNLLKGEVVLIKGKDDRAVFLQVDKETNTIVIQSARQLNIPNEIGGHMLTDLEKTLLANGKYTSPIVMYDKDNRRYFRAEVGMTADKKGIEFKDTRILTKEEAGQLLRNPEQVLQEKKEEKEEVLPSPAIDKKLEGMDEKILLAIKTEDYKTIHEVVKSGYQPSEELKKTITDMELPELKKEGVKKLLGIEDPAKMNTKANVKLEKDNERNREQGNVKDAVLKGVNQLFQ